MALISKGIELYLKTTTVGGQSITAFPLPIGVTPSLSDGQYIPNLQEVGELAAGGAAERDKIEVTTLADDKHTFVDGIQAESEYEGITFKLLYDASVYSTLNDWATTLEENETIPEWVVAIPSGGKFGIKGKYALKFDGAAVNAALTMTLTITPAEEITFSAQ